MCLNLTRRVSVQPTIISLAVVLLPIVVIAALSIYAPIDEKTSNRLWQAIAATATAGAGAIALYLGLSEQRKRNKEQKEDAELLEIIIIEDLKGLLPLLGQIGQIFSSIQRSPSESQAQSEKIINAIKEAAQIMAMPNYQEVFPMTKVLSSDKKTAILKIYASIHNLKRRCASLKDIKQIGGNIGNYVDSGLQIHADIRRIAYYSKLFLPDQSKHYWRGLKIWSDAYDPDEKSFHDLAK